jgi:hypothetical protein
MEKKYKSESEYFKSKEFKESFNKTVELNTWEKGLPKIYMDKNRNIVEHWKDGTINLLKTKEELNEK